MGSISIQPFIDACDNTDRLEGAAAEGMPVIGYLCNYTPLELVHACGCVPFRITGGPGPLDRAHDLLPDFVCPFLKRVTERAMNNDFDFISGIVQGYTCDAACGVVKVLEKNISGRIFEVIPFPYTDHGDSRIYFRRVLTAVREQLDNLGGGFSDQRLNESLALYGEIRGIIDHLYDLRYAGRLPMTAGELWHVVRAGERTRPEDYLAMLQRLEEGIWETSKTIEDDRTPVLLSGSLVEDAVIFDVIEQCGGRVAADDLCTGVRTTGALAASDEGDALDRLIRRHFSRIPCPSRVSAEDRLDGLMDAINRSGALGALFLHQKFCSPHLSDFPYLSSRLREAGIRSIQIEMDETWRGSGQFKTRMEGFFEMLEA